MINVKFPYQFNIKEAIMVKVNDYTITQNEFVLASDDYKVRLGKEKLSKEEYLAVLNKLIDARLLIEEARKTGVELADNELDSAYKSFKAMYKSEEDFFKILRQIGDTEDSFKNKLCEDMLLRKYIKDNFYSGIDIDEEEIKRIYDENAEAFVTEEEVNANHILVESQEEAELILNMLKDGGSFEELAKTHSKCPSGKNGGSLGSFKRGAMVKEFEDAAFNLKTGEISEPVKTQFGYHLIKATGRTDSSKMGYDEAKKLIQNDLINEVVGRKMLDKLEALRKESSIEYDQPLFDSITG